MWEIKNEPLLLPILALISTYSELFIFRPQSALEQLQEHVELNRSCIVMLLAGLWFPEDLVGFAGSLISLTTEVIYDLTQQK